MRLALALTFLTGCLATSSPAPVTSVTRVHELAPSTTPRARPHANELRIEFQGNTELTDIDVQMLTPNLAQVFDERTVDDHSMTGYLRYTVPPQTSIVRFQALGNFTSGVSVLVCRRRFTNLEAWYENEPVPVTEIRTDMSCQYQITLPHRASQATFPPLITANGNGMWGTRTGPPVPPEDDRLPLP